MPAAITGTFFGLNNREPTGDIVIDGRSAWRGFIGTAVAITAGNRVAFIPTRYKDPTLDWSRYETVIRLSVRVRPLEQWRTARELRRRIWHRLDQLNIGHPPPDGSSERNCESCPKR